MTSSSRRQRILIVDDDAPLRQLYRTALTFDGFEVQEVGDGLDALRQLDSAPPDLVILDLVLPTLSGLAVREELAAQVHTRDIPIVVITGSTLPVDTLDVPCVLRKPVAPDALVAVVRRCLAAGARGAS